MPYDISVGDKFYRNTFSVRNKLAIPDLQTIVRIEGGRFWATHDYWTVGTKEKEYSTEILERSNLNPDCFAPDYIFVKGIKRNEKEDIQ